MERKTYMSPMMETHIIRHRLFLLGTSGDINEKPADPNEEQLVKPMFDSSFGEDNGNEW